jgi:c-di-GMP-binding flagellar brake protein YcgR
MLVTLKRAFQGDRSPGKERVTSGSKIKAILRQLKAEHELLCVTVPGCKDQANTAILGIDEKRGLFYLDELNTDVTHQALLRNRKLRVGCRLHGMELQFVALMLKTDTDGGLALYEMAIPKAIERMQRRENFRLRLTPGVLVPVSIPNLGGKTINGEAFDLSATGIGAFLRTRNIPSRGQILSGASLSIPSSRPLKTKLEVRFARQDAAHHMLRIGARFVGLEPKQERQIAQFLAEQQRKRRRRGPR